MSHRNTFFFTLAAILSLLSACSPQPEAPAPETVLTAPPELTVTAGNQSCTALRAAGPGRSGRETTSIPAPFLTASTPWSAVR